MSEPDQEFEDFLKRRKPLFRREQSDELEPPPELDRLVLGRARQAIRDSEPDRVYRGPRWAAPMAVAATLLLALAFVFYAGPPEAQRREAVPEVRVENVAQQIEVAPPGADAASGASAADHTGDTVVVDLAPPAAASSTHEWRRNAATWLAEIERLRAAGDIARADAEQAEYNRQHRAYAGSPDR